MVVIDKDLNVILEGENIRDLIVEILLFFFELPLEYETMEELELLEYLLRNINKCIVTSKEVEDFQNKIKSIEEKIKKIKGLNG